jgi:hypothetical protein
MSNFVPRVDRHVAYLLEVSPGFVKRRPATITSVVAGTIVDLRVGHHGETYAGVDIRVNHDDVGVYVPY